MPNFVRKKREEMLSKVNIIFISLQRPLDTIIQPAPISTQRSADLRVQTNIQKSGAPISPPTGT